MENHEIGTTNKVLIHFKNRKLEGITRWNQKHNHGIFVYKNIYCFILVGIVFSKTNHNLQLELRHKDRRAKCMHVQPKI